MVTKRGEHWLCMNPACQCEILVESNGQIEGSNPRCVCGGIMKKKYAPPHLTYLEFLRFEEPVITRIGSHE